MANGGLKTSALTQRSRSINPARHFNLTANNALPLGTIINKHSTPVRSSNFTTMMH